MDDISMSIEATNLIRLSLGLKPLVEDKSEEDVPTIDEAESNYATHRTEQLKRRREQDLADKAQRSHNQTQSSAVISGVTLAHDLDDDNAAWIMRQRESSKIKSIARVEEKKVQGVYTSNDLAGIKVAHSFEDIEQDTILVLKDSYIDEDDDDKVQLVNISMMDSAVAKRSNLNKQKKYSAVDEEEKGRSILAHYDEDLDGGNAFTLGALGTAQQLQTEASVLQTHLDANTVSLAETKRAQISDFYAAGEEPIKRVKTKRQSRKKEIIKEEVEEDGMLIDGALPRLSHFNSEIYDKDYFDDGEDLQAALAAQRREANKKVKHVAVYEESQAVAPAGGIVFTATRDFVNNIGVLPKELEEKRMRDEKKAMADRVQREEMNELIREEQQSLITVTEEDTVMIADVIEEQCKEEHITDEPLVSSGLASTLALLNRRGLIDKMTSEEKDLDIIQKDRQKWSLEQKKKKTNTPNPNAKMNMNDSKTMDEKWKNYVPDVQLQYQDEFGRNLTKKEAFNQLCYKFHGVQPGKQKTAKRLEKIQKEQQQLTDAQTYAESGTVRALESQTKALGTAHLVIQRGNKTLALPEEVVVGKKKKN